MMESDLHLKFRLKVCCNATQTKFLKDRLTEMLQVLMPHQHPIDYLNSGFSCSLKSQET